MILKIVRFISLILLFLFSAYLVFISGISLVVGFTNTHRPGFWMPILCGFLILILVSFLARLIVYIIRRPKSREKYLSL
jgi:hypothetical protein